MFIVCCMLIGLLDDAPKKPDVKKPELREELLARTIRDQKARMAMIEKTKALAAAGKEVDRVTHYRGNSNRQTGAGCTDF